MTDPRRALPGVDVLLATEAASALVERHGREPVVDALRAALDEARRALAAPDGGSPEAGEPAAAGASAPDPALLLERAAGLLADRARPSLRRVINATGVVLHTNLGRAPLADAALEAMAEVGRGYSNLEFDLDAGTRGSRYDHCADLVVRHTGAEAALVVNNGAAAVALAVNTVARGRAVLVSRGELVEIGGGFRIPEMLERAGARLAEVGSTNRTRLADYRRGAEAADPAAILKVHRSNFKVEGFTEEAGLEELSGLAKALGVPLLHDLGSGMLTDPARLGLPREPRPRESLERGADLVAFSGDKVLGGPQAGLLAGRADLVARMRDNPLCRAFRVDKATLAALEATLRLHEDPDRAVEQVPALRMLAAGGGTLRERALSLARSLEAAAAPAGVDAVESRARVGGGTFPGVDLPSWALRIAPAGEASAEALARRLRAGDPPVVGRVAGGALLLDLRSVPSRDDPDLERALRAALGGGAGPPGDSG